MAAHTDVDRNIATQIELCKDKNPPNWFCWNPPDGSTPSGPFQTREIALRYAMAHYRDHGEVADRAGLKYHVSRGGPPFRVWLLKGWVFLRALLSRPSTPCGIQTADLTSLPSEATTGLAQTPFPRTKFPSIPIPLINLRPIRMPFESLLHKKYLDKLSRACGNIHRERRLPLRSLFPFWNSPSPGPSHPAASTNSLRTASIPTRSGCRRLPRPRRGV